MEDLPFDRVLSLSPELPVSTLYVDVNSPLFGHFHSMLSSTARTGRTSYRVRYRRPPTSTTTPLVLSGYGVELALKRTDYIVIDDRGKTSDKNEGTNTKEINIQGEELNDLKPLSSSELLQLGVKASSFILASEDPFTTLLKVSQDFPIYSSTISKFGVSAEFVTEHRANREYYLPVSSNTIWMNGMQIEARQMDAFALLDQLRHERQLIGNIKDVGLSGPEAISLVSHTTIAGSKVAGEALRYDYRDDLEGGNVIIWLNDIEKDKRYEDWPGSPSAVSRCHIMHIKMLRSCFLATTTYLSWPATECQAQPP